MSVIEVMDKVYQSTKANFPPLPFSSIKIMKIDAAAAAVQARRDKTIRFGLLSSIKAVENRSDEVMAQETQEEEVEENLNISQIKQHLFAALQGAEKKCLIKNICNSFVLTSLKKRVYYRHK